MTTKQILNSTRHDFLLTLFPDKELKYAVIQLNGFTLIRQWNGTSNRWEVAIHHPVKNETKNYSQSSLMGEL